MFWLIVVLNSKINIVIFCVYIFVVKVCVFMMVIKYVIIICDRLYESCFFVEGMLIFSSLCKCFLCIWKIFFSDIFSWMCLLIMIIIVINLMMWVIDVDMVILVMLRIGKLNRLKIIIKFLVMFNMFMLIVINIVFFV